MKIVLLLLLGLFTWAGQAYAQTPFFEEDFEGVTNGNLPSGWTRSQNTPSVGWSAGDEAFFRATASVSGGTISFSPPKDGKFACTNDLKADNAAGTQNLANRDRLITPSLDISSFAGQGKRLLMEFEWYSASRPQGSSVDPGFFLVDYSPDGGTTWRLLDSLAVPTSRGWRVRGVNFSRLADSSFASNVRLAFRYNDNNKRSYGWAIDNVKMYEQVQYDISSFSTIPNYYVSAGNISIPLTLTNKGYSAITSTDIRVQVDNSPSSVSTQAVSIPAFNNSNQQFVALSLGVVANLTTPGIRQVKVWTENPNTSGVDGNKSNDTVFLTFNVIANRPAKKVLAEEFTGAWCQFCPDGHATMDQIVRGNSNIIPALSHYGDGMETTETEEINLIYADGWPSAMFDRIGFLASGVLEMSTSSRSAWSTRATQRFNAPVPLTVSLSHTYDPQTRNVSATVTYNSIAADQGEFRYNLLILEDSVVGFGSAFDQVNAYNNTTGSPFFNKGNPIVGYVHNHVVRDYVGGTFGDGAFNSLTAGGTGSKTYTFTLPSNVRANFIKLVGVVSRHVEDDLTQREILNSADAWLIQRTTANEPRLQNEFSMRVMPNPVTDLALIELNLPQTAQPKMSIYSIMGQEVYTQDLGGMLKGTHTAGWDVRDNSGQSVPNGIYIVKIQVGEQTLTQKVIVAR